LNNDTLCLEVGDQGELVGRFVVYQEAILHMHACFT
jgi:hypothetical protein